MDKSRLRTVKWWQFHHLLWRYKFIVLAIIVIGTFTSILYTSRIPKEYRATASAMADTFSNMANQDYGGPTATDMSRAHKVLAESNPVKEKAIRACGLSPLQAESASFEARVDGVLIYFSVTHGDYAIAKKLADAWAESFIKELSLRAKLGGEDQVKSLTTQLTEYQGQWDTAEKKMAEFDKSHKFDPLQYEKDSIHAEVSAYDTKMRLADDQLVTLNKELKIIKDPSIESAHLVQLQYVSTDVAFLDRLKRVKELDMALVEIKGKYREGPEWRAGEEQFKEAQRMLEQSRKELAGALSLKSQVLQNDYDQAKVKYVESVKIRDEKSSFNSEHNTLQSEIAKVKRNYELVNARLSETLIAVRMNHNNVIKWEDAPDIQNPLPFKPNWRQNIGVGVIFSMLLACVLAFGLEQIDDSVRTPKDLEERLGATVLGAVPACGRTSMDREGYFLAKRQSGSIAVDSLRGIHIALEVGRRSASQNGALVITVTSAVPQDGKSFVTSNLGILFASLGRRVLVVDADLRKASLSKALNAADRDGFFEIVKNQKWTRDYAMNGKTPGYYLLSAGHVAQAISESLHPDSVTRLVDQMRKDFDVILFDTPPVLALPDACVLGQISDVTVLVTRSRHTRMAQAERAAATLLSAKVKDLVFVVNGVDAADAASDTYGAGYGYGYGYGKGYGREDGANERGAKVRSPAESANGSDQDDEEEDA